MFPGNSALRKIAQKRSLEIVDLSPDELQEVEQAEEQMQSMMQQQGMQGMQSPMQPMKQLTQQNVPQLAAWN